LERRLVRLQRARSSVRRDVVSSLARAFAKRNWSTRPLQRLHGERHVHEATITWTIGKTEPRAGQAAGLEGHLLMERHSRRKRNSVWKRHQAHPDHVEAG